MELINLSDEEQGVVVRILRGGKFGEQPEYDFLEAEIIVSSHFAQGRLDLSISGYDLEVWRALLVSLSSGRSVTWLESGRSPRLIVNPEGDSGCAEISVYDAPVSQIEVTVPVSIDANWISRHRSKLDAIEREFPLI
ncbi:DUF5959 family protein [Streptomyces chumphonensis]|uniref:Uncharacterized protein n=1 Tax=Streptomyces chumphonensis TaxID=1214925 RepID=A0A927F1F1_9ACTN|nr:DUF5959 family protein [Streptomyces chumphonensis]MBD3932464.1 hypothetical protein [Streptomyces chumphonensis]